MTRDDIKDIVKHKLDEVSHFDTYQIDSVAFIEEFLDSAAEKILLTVPLYLIPPTSFADEPHDERSNGTGIVHLPTDYLRLSSFKMTEWDRPVSMAISQQHPVYNLQKNNITRGKPSKPICVIGYYKDYYDSDSGSDYGGTKYVKCIEYFSVVTDHTIDDALYVQKLTADTDFPENLTDVLAWQCAADILQVVGGEKASAYCNAQVQKFISDNTLKL